MLVLDVDDGTPARELLQAFADWPYICHTSWSHTETEPRYRVVLPLEEPVKAALWGRVFAWAQDRAGGHLDEACKDPSRIWFRPAVRRQGWPFHCISRDPGGGCLGLRAENLPPTRDELAEKRRRARPAPRMPATVSARAVTRAAQERLKVDPAARESAGLRAGGQIANGRAVKIPCPGCGRASVWFLIAPDRMAQAECNHRNSCGWSGWLDQLPGVV